MKTKENQIEDLRERLDFEQGEVQRLTTEMARIQRQHEASLVKVNEQMAIEAERRNQVQNQLTYAQQELRSATARAKAPFTRAEMEGMSRLQLVSLIEEAINEARRKGMTEAEGLLSRHRELTRSTDLEMMRGVVSTYQARITAIELDQRKSKEQAAAPVKLDARPLTEKLQPAGTALFNRPLASTYNAPNWWRNDVPGPTPPPKPVDYLAFDAKAKVTIQETRAKAFVEGSRVPVRGTHGGTYILERHGDVFSCTCPAWQFAKGVTNQRSCKHLQAHLGAAVEQSRVAANFVVPQKSCWCGVVLVRGQCQIHTAKWLGDEHCNCGRLFSHCKEEYAGGRAPTREWHAPRLLGTPEPARPFAAALGHR